MIELDIRNRTKNATPTPSVVRNPTPQPWRYHAKDSRWWGYSAL